MKYIFIAVCVLLFGFASNSFGEQKAVDDAYFDVATGHTYLKNADGYYSEYSRKGQLLRADYPGTSALLTRGKYIRRVLEDAYIIYEQNGATRTVQKILPAGENHPQGWRARALLARLKAASGDTGLGYTRADGYARFEKGEIKITGPYYYDLSTGHRYIQNPDQETYCEYSRKGRLLATDVPATLPLLLTGKNIVNLTSQDYILYEKGRGSQSVSQVLDIDHPHPAGWRSSGLLSKVQ